MIKNTNYSLDLEINDAAKLNKIATLPSSVKPLINNRIRRGNTYAFFSNCRPYDLTEAYRIADTESFVSASLRRKKTLILKDGYKLVSENKDDIDYLTDRLEEIQYVTNKSFKSLLEEMVTSVIHNHNLYLYIARSKNSSTGNVRKINGVKKDPIAGYFFLPEMDVELLENEIHELVGYKYNVCRGLYNEFNKDEVLHLIIEKKPNLNIGTPPLESVKDDILSLRQIEESLERLIYKLSIPLIHLQVGTETRPAGKDRLTGRLEVDIANDQMASIDEAGGIVTSERVNIHMIGAESQALRLSSYIDYYKNRVLVGLSTSEVDLGTGNSTTGGAAAIVSEALKQNVEMYQTYLETFITENILTPLLLESDKYKDKLYLSESEKVLFKFEKTNLDIKIKLESHYLNEVNLGTLTADEYRVLTGRRPFTKKEKQELLEKVTGPQTKGGSSNPISNSTNPTNQHTTNAIRDELSLSSYLDNIEENRITTANNMLYSKLSPILDELVNDDRVKNFVTELTTALQTYIIGKVPRDSIINAVETLLCKNILEYIDSK